MTMHLKSLFSADVDIFCSCWCVIKKVPCEVFFVLTCSNLNHPSSQVDLLNSLWWCETTRRNSITLSCQMNWAGLSSSVSSRLSFFSKEMYSGSLSSVPSLLVLGTNWRCYWECCQGCLGLCSETPHFQHKVCVTNWEREVWMSI